MRRDLTGDFCTSRTERLEDRKEARDAFNDDTWLASIPGQGGSGYFHTEALHVVERITRIGVSLRWEATAEDPNVLAKAWVMTPQ